MTSFGALQVLEIKMSIQGAECIKCAPKCQIGRFGEKYNLKWAFFELFFVYLNKNN